MRETYISVGGLLVRDDLSVLLQLRDDKPSILYPGYWSIPSGRLEPGETLQQGAVRELLEETGYLMAFPKPLPPLDGVLPTGQPVTYHIFWDTYDGAQPIHVYEGRAMRFIPTQQAPSLNLIPGSDIIIAACITAYQQQLHSGPKT